MITRFARSSVDTRTHLWRPVRTTTDGAQSWQSGTENIYGAASAVHIYGFNLWGQIYSCRRRAEYFSQNNYFYATQP